MYTTLCNVVYAHNSAGSAFAVFDYKKVWHEIDNRPNKNTKLLAAIRSTKLAIELQ